MWSNIVGISVTNSMKLPVYNITDLYRLCCFIVLVPQISYLNSIAALSYVYALLLDWIGVADITFCTFWQINADQLEAREALSGHEFQSVTSPSGSLCLSLFLCVFTDSFTAPVFSFFLLLTCHCRNRHTLISFPLLWSPDLLCPLTQKLHIPCDYVSSIYTGRQFNPSSRLSLAHC